MQRLDRGGGVRLDRIGDREQPGRLAVERDQHHGLAVGARGGGARREIVGCNAQRLQQGAVADRDPPAVDHAGDALAGMRLEIDRNDNGHAARRRARDDGAGERMLAGALQAGGDREQGSRVDRADRDHVDQAWPAFGQGAGLVDHQRIDPLHQLQRLGVADQHAGLRATPGADHDRHRGREPERAGTGR